MPENEIKLFEHRYYLLKGLCPTCTDKLNYHSKRREVKRMKKQTKHISHKHNNAVPSSSKSSEVNAIDSTPKVTPNAMEMGTSQNIDKMQNKDAHQQLEQIFWSKSTTDDIEKTREEEFDEYLADLLL